ncbi:MAG: iron hydrogenase, partial [Roseburia sp.]|nr:iron hydrogenase [Roseburia sp.]
MKTFHELYLEILKQEAKEGRHLLEDYNPYHMDCLLHPEKYAPVIHTEKCEECAYEKACVNSCVFDAIEKREDGTVHIDQDKCAGCG